MLLENVDIPVTELNKDDSVIPELPGIYAYIDNEMGGFYIGKATNLKERYRGHKYNKKAKSGIDRILYEQPEDIHYRILIMGVNPSILDSLEGTFIQRYEATQIGFNIRNDKATNINPDESKIVEAYSDLRNKYYKLHNNYVSLYQKYQNLLERTTK